MLRIGLLTINIRYLTSTNNANVSGEVTLNHVASSSITGAQILRKGLSPPNLAAIKDFFRFIVATSTGFINPEGERVTVDLLNTFTEWFFTGFGRVTGNRIEADDRSAVYNVSTILSSIEQLPS